MKVVREYPGSHHYTETYTKTDIYCPSCGKQEVWKEDGPGDYYQGTDYMCVACGHIHRLDNSQITPSEPWHHRICEQLKTGVTDTPTTKLGN